MVYRDWIEHWKKGKKERVIGRGGKTNISIHWRGDEGKRGL